MKKTTLPKTELNVSTLGFGTAGLGTALTGEATLRLVADFAEAGGNFFDTAHCYAFWEPNGLGASERELGRALHRLGYHGHVIVSTKGGHPDGGEKYRRPDDYLSESLLYFDIENSLFRLGVNMIDLYFLHRDDGRTPVGEVIERLNGFIKRGWLRYIGASNWSVERIAAANSYAKEKGLQGFVASQIQGSLATPIHPVGDTDPTTRFIDDVTADWHRQSGLPITAYSATANGYFSDHPAPLATTLYDDVTNQARRERAQQLAKEFRCTPTQIALAYLMCQTDFPILPIFSTTRREHLKEILGAVKIDLSADQVRWLRG